MRRKTGTRRTGANAKFVTYALTVVVSATQANCGVGRKMAPDQHFHDAHGHRAPQDPESDMAASLQPKGNAFHCALNLLLSSGRMLRGHFGGLSRMRSLFGASVFDKTAGWR